MCSLLVLCLGLGYSFRISDFFEPFNEGRQGIDPETVSGSITVGNSNFNEGRQDDVGDQIVPVFTVAFLATVLNNILASFQPG